MGFSITNLPAVPGSVTEKPRIGGRGSTSEEGQAGVVFVFLEIFSCEGGIQSYIQDMFRAYLDQADPAPADVFLLRDGDGVDHPFDQAPLRFHYFASSSPGVGRAKLIWVLLGHWVRHRPSRVLCGHVLLLPLVAPSAAGSIYPIR